jgi:N-acetylmuramoyl-L-alanine amidase
MTAVVNRTATAAGAGTCAHYYVFRNGCIVQMCREANVAFHAGAPPLNRNSIGIEHADICNDPAPYTQELYERSAELVRDIRRRHGFPLRVFGVHTNDRDLATVIAHSDILPGHHGDPGPYWDWEYCTKLLEWDGQAATRPVRLVSLAALNPTTPTGWQARHRPAIAADHCATNHHSYGHTFWRATANTPGNDVVSRFTVGLPGTYKISVRWPLMQGANAQTMVEADVQKAGGPAMARGVLNQTRNFGRWNDLGQPFVFSVPPGGAQFTVRIRRASPTRGWILADAVRVLRV